MTTEKNITGYEFLITFVDGAEILTEEGKTIELEDSDYPEGDQDKSHAMVDEYAEKTMDEYGADDYEIKLVNVY